MSNQKTSQSQESTPKPPQPTYQKPAPVFVGDSVDFPKKK